MGWTRQEVLDVARSTGRPVVEAWSAHDAGQMGTVLGPMLHHTGSVWSYPTYKAPTLRVVRDGRAGLENALSMYYIDYEGVIYCITEKIAWHAGGGFWQGVTDGNGHYAGIEAESDGVQWTKPTVASYKRLAAAILRKTGRTVAYAPRHADYALPKGRKTDFSGLDPASFLADVNAALSGTAIEPTPEEYQDMKVIQSDKRGIALVGPGYYRQLTDAEDVNSAIMLWGSPHVDNERRFDVWVSQAINGTGVSGTASALTSLAAQVSGIKPADVDEDALAALLAPKLSGTSKTDVADALRQVLREGTGA